MNTLTKADIAASLVEKMGVKQFQAKQLVEAFFEEITAILCRGEHVKLSGFGKFVLRDKNPRPGRNPKTGKEVTIKSRRVVTFRSGHKLRQRIMGQGEEDVAEEENDSP